MNNSNIQELYKYIKTRKMEVVFVYLFTILLYGVWMAQNLVTFDAEGFYFEDSGLKWYEQWYQLGRWSLVVMKKILNVKLVNPYFQLTTLGIFFPASVILWWFCFYKWNHFKESKFALLVFSGLYISHPIWTMQFSYRNQMEAITIIMILLPIAMLLLTDRVSDGRWIRIIVAAALVIVSFGAYQSFMFLYAEAIVIYLLFRVYYDYMQEGKKDCWREVVFLAFFTVVCYVIYSCIAKYMCSIRGLTYGTDYLRTQFHWGTYSLAENVETILGYIKETLLGDGVVYNALGAVEIIVGLVMVIYAFRNRIGARILALLLFIGSWIIPFVLVIVTAADIVDRSQFSFTLTLAFWGAMEFGALYHYFFRIRVTDIRALFFVFILACAIVPQMQKTTRLLYTDYMIMHMDEVQLWTIYYEAMQKGAEEGDTIVFVGAKGNYLTGSMVEKEVVGFSYLEANDVSVSGKIVEAMRAYGMNVEKPTDEQIKYAKEVAETMESWPDSEGIVVEDGLIIVKLS